MSFGYVYVMSNPSMPGLYKIGFTTRPIDERLQEANQPNTWIPTPFLLEFAKFVVNPQQKEMTVHKILTKERINPNREFFRADIEQVKLLFDLMDTTQIPEPEPDTESRLIGDEVLHLFLDSFIYPSVATDEAVPWPKIQACFQTWKREQGYTAGNAMKLREMLIEAYGKPNRGEGWSAFRLKISSTQ
jgi:hypothetical protein